MHPPTPSASGTSIFLKTQLGGQGPVVSTSPPLEGGQCNRSPKHRGEEDRWSVTRSKGRGGVLLPPHHQGHRLQQLCEVLAEQPRGRVSWVVLVVGSKPLSRAGKADAEEPTRVFAETSDLFRIFVFHNCLNSFVKKRWLMM